MNDTTRQSTRKQDTNATQETQKAAEGRREAPLPQSKPGQPKPPEGISRFEKYAATQGAGDGIEGDVLKPGKTVDEKLGANMADRK